MEEKDFEAKLRSVNEVKFPLVKAGFKGKDGNVYIGMMLIDTGSVDCILNKSVLSLIDSSLIREDDKKVIHSIQSDANTCQGVDFTFKMGNEVFSDIFYVNEEIDFNQMFEGFIGIIGHEFLRKHQLVLDYSSKTLHGSYGNFGNPSDYDFFFPMEYGIKQYNIPVVGLVYGTKEYIMVADSGANDNVITQFVIDESGYQLTQSRAMDLLLVLTISQWTLLYKRLISVCSVLGGQNRNQSCVPIKIMYKSLVNTNT